MLGQVLAYGSRHPDEFGSYGLVWHAGGDASVFVSFTGHLDDHRNALAAIVESPDELIVCQVALPGDVAQALQAQLADQLEGRFLSIGQGTGAIEVVLASDEAALAGDLHARYGDAIELTVGALAYPIEEAVSVCGDPPAGNTVPGLVIEIVRPVEPISAPGLDPADLTVTLTNVGASPIRFNSGVATGTILDTNGNVVNSNTLPLAALGIQIDLAPGASTELPLLVSTASCDPTLGYTLPPGTYQLVAAVPHIDGEVTTLGSEPTSIAISS